MVLGEGTTIPVLFGRDSPLHVPLGSRLRAYGTYRPLFFGSESVLSKGIP